MDAHDHWTIRAAGAQDIAAVLGLWAAAGSPPRRIRTSAPMDNMLTRTG